MRKVFSCFVLHFFLISISSLLAQEKSNFKFGKIFAEDFKPVYKIDSNANAVVIADIGSSDIVAEGSWFQIVYKRYRRVHILKKAGYEAANISIPVFVNSRGDENLETMKAVTYNYENGQVVESKLDIASVYTDKLSKYIHLKKFAMPNVREGSIIEIELKMFTNSLLNLPSWEFQGVFPVLWSEYKASIPEFFYYLIQPQGYRQFYINEKKESSSSFIIRGSYSYYAERAGFSATVADHRWVMKDVPALKDEGYTSTIKNHIAKIEFLLSAYRYPLIDRNLLLNWKEVTADLLNAESVGLQIKKDNSWLKDVVDSASKGLKTEIEKARSMFNYIRDNFHCTDYDQVLPGTELKEIFKGRRGSVASINFLLIALLRKAGIAADPVMLSTKTNGYPPLAYPVLTKYDFLICKATLDGTTVYLDASHPLLGFGKLEWQCYNGPGRAINEQATVIMLSADSLMESNTVSVQLTNDGKGNLTGFNKKSSGYYESYKIRKQIKEKGKEEFFKEIKNNVGADISIGNHEIEGLNDYNSNLQLTFDIQVKTDGVDILYVNPMFGEGKTENPFKSSERLYPVEMPYTMDDVYILKMEIPDGYQLEELPKSGKLNYDDEGRSFFEYIISERNGTIMLRSRIKVTKTYFSSDEYEVLREFYAQIVNKHNEEIVLKKKK
jgi:hypothetical protein